MQPKASVAANTGAGQDIFWGLYSLPHLFPQKVLDVSDVAEYLGKKYGGWVPSAEAYGKSGDKWIAIPICYSGNMVNYRIEASNKAGFSKFPTTTRRVPRIHQGDESEQYAGRLCARTRIGRRQWLGALVLVVSWRQCGR